MRATGSRRRRSGSEPRRGPVSDAQHDGRCIRQIVLRTQAGVYVVSEDLITPAPSAPTRPPIWCEATIIERDGRVAPRPPPPSSAGPWAAPCDPVQAVEDGEHRQAKDLGVFDWWAPPPADGSRNRFDSRKLLFWYYGLRGLRSSGCAGGSTPRSLACRCSPSSTAGLDRHGAAHGPADDGGGGRCATRPSRSDGSSPRTRSGPGRRAGRRRDQVLAHERHAGLGGGRHDLPDGSGPSCCASDDGAAWGSLPLRRLLEPVARIQRRYRSRNAGNDRPSQERHEAPGDPCARDPLLCHRLFALSCDRRLRTQRKRAALRDLSGDEALAKEVVSAPDRLDRDREMDADRKPPRCCVLRVELEPGSAKSAQEAGIPPSSSRRATGPSGAVYAQDTPDWMDPG